MTLYFGPFVLQTAPGCLKIKGSCWRRGRKRSKMSYAPGAEHRLLDPKPAPEAFVEGIQKQRYCTSKPERSLFGDLQTPPTGSP